MSSASHHPKRHDVVIAVLLICASDFGLPLLILSKKTAVAVSFALSRALQVPVD